MSSTRVAVAPNKYAKGFDGSGREVPEAYVVVDLVDALHTIWKTDAHLVSYVVAGATRQSRINKAGLPYFDRQVEVSAFFCDVDNPDHRTWDDQLLAEALGDYERMEVLQSAGDRKSVV